MVALGRVDEGRVTVWAQGSPEREYCGPGVERLEIDGVPVFWAPDASPGQAGLMFRVGRADETLATSGLTHVVEHLALFPLDDGVRRIGGFVDPVRTVFSSLGAPSELGSFLSAVCQSVSALPFDRLETERRVLLTEEGSAERSILHWLMGLRFGAAGFGLIDYRELGLRHLTPDNLDRWAKQRFVSGNAAVWIAGPLPEDLTFPLRPGLRSAPPNPTSSPRLRSPAYVASDGGGVAMSFLGSRSAALTVGLELLERRVHRNLRLQRGLSYSASSTYLPLTSTIAHVTFGADCLDEHAQAVRDGIVAELQRLAHDGPDTAELATAVQARVEHWSDEQPVVASDLDALAMAELLGDDLPTRDALRREHQSLTRDGVAAALHELMPTAILAAPTGDAVPEGFAPFPAAPPQPLKGQRYMRRGRRVRDLPKPSRVIASPEGITLLPKNRDPGATIMFNEVAAVLELGPGRMTVVGLSGDGIQLDTNVLLKGRDLEGRLRHAIAASLFVDVQEEQGGSLIDLSRSKLGYRSVVANEVAALPGYLQRGERVLTLAVAVRKKRGLLALTDRRILFLAKPGSSKPLFVEIPLQEVTKVRRGLMDFIERCVKVRTTRTGYRFAGVEPRERADEFLQALKTPSSPSVVSLPPNTSIGGRLGAYGAGGVFMTLGAFAVLHHYVAGLMPLLFGARRIYATYSRRRASS